MAEGIKRKSIAREALLGLGKGALYVLFGVVGAIVGFGVGLAVTAAVGTFIGGGVTLVAIPYLIYRGVRLANYTIKTFAESKDVLPGI